MFRIHNRRLVLLTFGDCLVELLHFEDVWIEISRPGRRGRVISIRELRLDSEGDREAFHIWAREISRCGSSYNDVRVVLDLDPRVVGVNLDMSVE